MTTTKPASDAAAADRQSRLDAVTAALKKPADAAHMTEAAIVAEQQQLLAVATESSHAVTAAFAHRYLYLSNVLSDIRHLREALGL